MSACKIKDGVEKAVGDQLFGVFSSARTRGALKARGKFKKGKEVLPHTVCFWTLKLPCYRFKSQLDRLLGQCCRWYRSVWQLMSWGSQEPHTKSRSPLVLVLGSRSGMSSLLVQGWGPPSCSTKKKLFQVLQALKNGRFDNRQYFPRSKK